MSTLIAYVFMINSPTFLCKMDIHLDILCTFLQTISILKMFFENKFLNSNGVIGGFSNGGEQAKRTIIKESKFRFRMCVPAVRGAWSTTNDSGKMFNRRLTRALQDNIARKKKKTKKAKKSKKKKTGKINTPRRGMRRTRNITIVRTGKRK